MSEMNELDLMIRGKQALAEGDNAAAQDAFRQVVKLNPGSTDAWLMLAETTDEADKKRVCFQNALKIDPENVQAQIGIAKLDVAPAAAPVPPTPAAAPRPVSSETDSPESLRPSSDGRQSMGGPSVALPKGVDGAPEHLNMDFLAGWFQGAAKGSLSTLTMQGDGSDSVGTSWFNVAMMVIVAGLIFGLLLAINSLSFLNPLALITLPLLTIVQFGGALMFGSLISHWYMRAFGNGSSTLLEHTMAWARVWFPLTVIFSILLLVGIILNSQGVSLALFLTRFGLGGGSLGVVLTIVNIAIAAFAVFLTRGNFSRIYGSASSNALWIGAALAVLMTGLF
jgi:hypothetical protein